MTTASRLAHWILEVHYTGPQRAVDLDGNDPPASFDGPFSELPAWLHELGATTVHMDLTGPGHPIAEHLVRNGIRVFGHRPREVHL